MSKYLRISLYFLFAFLAATASITSKEITHDKSQLSKDKLSNRYSLHFLRLIQITFGTESIISQGGIDSIEDMFSGVSLDGKKILDVGCGFGGMDTYLAQNYNVSIIGIDKEPYMIQQAKAMLANEQTPFLGEVFFQNMSKSIIPLDEFDDDTFDIVCCKEMMYHIPPHERQLYFYEMSRVLKPGGQIVIADWMRSEDAGERIQKLVQGDKKFCYFMPPKYYDLMLREAEFKNRFFRDVTQKHIQYTFNDIERLKKAESQVRQELGDDTYSSQLNMLTFWVEAMLAPAELIAGIYTATKM